MTRRYVRKLTGWSLFWLIVVVAWPATRANAAGAFDGEWRTSFGIATLQQADDVVTGTYGADGQYSLKGTVRGPTLTFEYQEGRVAGDARWTLESGGLSFGGSYQVRGGRAGRWEGWRPDPRAPEDKPAQVGGLWLTDLGLMEVEQDGGQVAGRFALRGTSSIEGTVTGRRFEFTYKAFGAGKGWFDVSSDRGAKFAGAAVDDGRAAWFGWRGRRAPEFARHAKLVPGKIVDGSTAGLLTYAARAPEGYRDGGDKRWPAVVILHGSNMNAKSYVATIAAAWPDVARDYLIVGINGERPSSVGDDPRFNYTYVSYVGRSTFKGYPGTDRESPALVAEALTELRAVYPVARYFVGGHSQGGFLTYSLLMNFPELIAGAFPVSAGVIFQCEPTAYADEKLRAAQRSVPLAIVHGKRDTVVPFDSAEYAATAFGEAGWPAFRFFADESPAGHRFGMLPVGEAVRWLEAHASDDPARLVDFAGVRMKAKGYRDAVAALNRARTLNPAGGVKGQADRLSRELNAKAAAGVADFLPKIRGGADGDRSWIDAFLAFRDDFQFAPAAAEAMAAFDELRAKHDGPARELLDQARVAFREGRRDEGYEKYQRIADERYAASSYRNVKRWLGERDRRAKR